MIQLEVQNLVEIFTGTVRLGASQPCAGLRVGHRRREAVPSADNRENELASRYTLYARIYKKNPQKHRNNMQPPLPHHHFDTDFPNGPVWKLPAIKSQQGFKNCDVQPEKKSTVPAHCTQFFSSAKERHNYGHRIGTRSFLCIL